MPVPIVKHAPSRSRANLAHWTSFGPTCSPTGASANAAHRVTRRPVCTHYADFATLARLNDNPAEPAGTGPIPARPAKEIGDNLDAT